MGVVGSLKVGYIVVSSRRMRRQWLSHRRILSTLLCRSISDNNMNWQNSAQRFNPSSGEVIRGRFSMRDSDVHVSTKVNPGWRSKKVRASTRLTRK